MTNAWQGKHAGVHEDQFRTSKQQRRADREISEAEWQDWLAIEDADCACGHPRHLHAMGGMGMMGGGLETDHETGELLTPCRHQDYDKPGVTYDIFHGYRGMNCGCEIYRRGAR